MCLNVRRFPPPSFIPSEAPPWDSRPVSGAGVVHYHSLHRPRSVPTALGPAPLVTYTFTGVIIYKDLFIFLCTSSTTVICKPKVLVPDNTVALDNSQSLPFLSFHPAYLGTWQVFGNHCLPIRTTQRVEEWVVWKTANVKKASENSLELETSNL